MFEESGSSLWDDATVTECRHLAPYEGLDELVVVKGAKALLELGHYLRSEEIRVG